MRVPVLRCLAVCLVCSALAAQTGSPRDRIAGAPAGAEALFAAEAVTVAGGTEVASRTALGNRHVHLEFQLTAGGRATVQLADGVALVLREPSAGALDVETCGALVGRRAPLRDAGRAAGVVQMLDVHYEHERDRRPRLSAWLNGELIHERVVLDGVDAGRVASLPGLRHSREAAESFDWSAAGFAVAARFRTERGGTLVAKAPPTGDWAPNAKALFLRGGHLVYDIGWVGALRSRRKWNDGEWHRVVLTHRDGTAVLYVDGELEADREDFAAPDVAAHVFKIGAAAPNFGGAYRGELGEVAVFATPLDDARARAWSSGDPDAAGLAAFAWSGGSPVSNTAAPARTPVIVRAEGGTLRVRRAWWRPLGSVDHAGAIAAWDDASRARGAKLYAGLCHECHGDRAQPGPAGAFWTGELRNGRDPHSLFVTLTEGLATKPASPWLTPELAYDVIHYVRDELLQQRAPIPVEERFALPPGIAGTAPPLPAVAGRNTESSRRADYGTVLQWTYEVADDNIAYKGIAVRLDPGAGGIAAGRAWMVYDHDTMRVAAAWTGSGFIDWRGVAFDGSHQTHARTVGETAFVNPVGPGWGRPSDESFADPRLRGRDGKPYGPLPREWVHYRGRFAHGERAVLAYEIGGTHVLELPGFAEHGAVSVFSRTLEIASRERDLVLRVAPDDVAVALVGGGGRIERRDGFTHVRVGVGEAPVRFTVLTSTCAPQTLAALALITEAPPALGPLTQGGPAQWAATIATRGRTGEDSGPFAVDAIRAPADADNPWRSRLRLGGFDLDADLSRAVVSTWNGDVWEVRGIGADLGELRWRRVAAGLFQPLGVKIVDGTIYVGCRDQIAALIDRNGDGEIDAYRNFNSDHQVTEHFHEFAMGLQRDAEGNFYYAKSARHALPALVPHHGTLLKVDRDGARTEIVANGFRAANGVCVNPDGTFFVTDQEGHWTPKNRINWVEPGGFYGNMFGYHDDESPADTAMRQPLCWITNEFDRSPAELLWVPSDRWGALGGSLLQISYGVGRVFLVPHETVGDRRQGGMVALPLPAFPTGVMRGRFSPADGHLYVAGLFGWSSNRTAPGGFYRVRRTAAALHVPVGLRASRRGLTLQFTEPLDPETAADAESYSVRSWSLRRSKNYGSDHHDERDLSVRVAQLSDDGRTVTLEIPDIAPTWCMEIRYLIDAADGTELRGVIHNTIHALRD